MAFKGASDKAQAKLRRPLLKDFGNFDELMTDEEYLNLLRTLVRKLEAQLTMMKPGPQRKIVAGKKNQLSLEINAVTGKRGKPGRSLAHCFMDIVRERVGAGQFKEWSDAALAYQEALIDLKHENFNDWRRLIESKNKYE